MPGGRHSSKKPTMYARQVPTHRYWLDVINFFASGGMPATLEQFFPGATGSAKETKRKSAHLWSKRWDELERLCAACTTGDLCRARDANGATTLSRDAKLELLKWINGLRRRRRASLRAYAAAHGPSSLRVFCLVDEVTRLPASLKVRFPRQDAPWPDLSRKRGGSSRYVFVGAAAACGRAWRRQHVQRRPDAYMAEDEDHSTSAQVRRADLRYATGRWNSDLSSTTSATGAAYPFLLFYFSGATSLRIGRTESLSVHERNGPASYTSVCLPADVSWNAPLKQRQCVRWATMLHSQLDCHNTNNGLFNLSPPSREYVIGWFSTASTDSTDFSHMLAAQELSQSDKDAFDALAIRLYHTPSRSRWRREFE
ncbi:hypothetical protein PybrP1_008478 [[Pythium] brassicae (nom. inval.)]|nr:hypothetical protein PybrP1_008478 [[Pythium] brassicae (nom. inval.)]